MNQRIYDRLVAIARSKNVISYSELAPLADLNMEDPTDRLKMGDLLGDISKHEHGHGRPMLSAVVVHKGKGNETPGSGFFALARELGLHREKHDIVFFAKELLRVHDYWKQHRADSQSSPKD